MSGSTAPVTGSLQAGQWTKVIWTWGLMVTIEGQPRPLSLIYSVRLDRPGGEYRCYTAPLPFPYSSGGLPARVTMAVVGYGDMWLYCPQDAGFVVVPVSREPLTGWPAHA
jgi:hypothetical protein